MLAIDMLERIETGRQMVRDLERPADRLPERLGRGDIAGRQIESEQRALGVAGNIGREREQAGGPQRLRKTALPAADVKDAPQEDKRQNSTTRGGRMEKSKLVFSPRH